MSGSVGVPARVALYTRHGCHLCEEARAELERARAREPFELEIVDVDGDPALREQFNDEVPVVFINGRKAFKYRVDARELARRLRSW